MTRLRWLGIGLVLISVAIASQGSPDGEPAAEASQTPDTSVQMIVPDGDGQAYWPRWRGPSGQGLVNGDGYPDTWSSTDNVVWKTAVPGRGNSSPIVWADRIFLTTAYDGGTRLAIRGYQRSDGALLWETVVPDGRPERLHAKNSHASATPTTDGTRVYASFGSQVVAVDFDGRLVWSRSLGALDNYHGSAGSPLLYRDRVIVYQDHEGGPEGGGFITAFDARTGETAWRTERAETVGWGTPIAIRADDHDEIIVSSQRRVYAYDPDTGDELWRCGGNLFEVIPTPVVGHGLVFCASGRAGPTLAIRPGGRGDVTETHVAWKTAKGSPFVPSPLLYGDYLYQVNDMASVITCYEAATGKVMWQGRLGEARREGFSASPVVVDGKVFFTNDAGETFVLRAGPTFDLLHVNDLGARTLASPALVDGLWYFRTEDHLIAIGE